MNKTGFTLIELMISVVILGLGICVVAKSFMSSFEGLSIAQDYLAAIPWASEKMAELRIEACQSPGLLSSRNSGNTVLGPREFNWNQEVEELSQPDYLVKDLLRAKVVVHWQRRAWQRSYALAAYLPKPKEDPGQN